ncbi:TPR domain protein [Methylococcus capsulatus str. Bath]|uniref:protein O-GlcNAc transferase n=1 Tax=Methylococcus capsulatus (strain ATCC 33009 / NCIMB 11132 / Bath) TaxID=243233 RepID=Q608I2_METCA|nr:tetratricopeptide repeat protein [Methylococcus capsulatus]AAU92442.1 TPR domain protein [Methylococcus capsulatus str. Bath]
MIFWRLLQEFASTTIHGTKGICHADELIEKGQIDKAEQAVLTLLERKPNDANILHLAGVVALRKGQNSRAVALISKALEYAPNESLYYFNLGNAYLADGAIDLGIQALQDATRLDPERMEAWMNLGLALVEAKRHPEAVAAFERLLEIDPDHEADVAFASALVGAGIMLKESAMVDRGISVLESKLRDGYERYAAGVILARALEHRNRLSEAIRQHQALLEANPEHIGIRNNLARCLVQLGRVEEARTHYRLCVKSAPDKYHAFSALLAGLNYEPNLTAAMHEAEVRNWEKQLALPHYPVEPEFPNERDPERPLKIGYLSPDLRQHVVGHNFLPVLEHRNREQFSVFCYHIGEKQDDMSRRIAALADHWRHVHGASDDEVAALIREDRVDILVDLSGHTSHTQPLVFARKPAPVQVSWLGYFDTTGLATMDWFITDPYSSPPDQKQYFSERLYRMPHTRLYYHPYPDMPAVGQLPAKRNGYITFGCLNNLAKINTEVLDLWAQILAASPTSRLLIQTVALCDRLNLERFRALCVERGLDPARLELRPATSLEKFAQTYHQIDIALDPFPFCGGFTSFDALWMGVPVITLEQQRLAGRQTLSMLMNLGLPHLIASNKTDYVSIALELSRDSSEIEQLRSELRSRFLQSPLIDHCRFTRELEKAYRFFWSHWCTEKKQSSARKGISAPMDAYPSRRQISAT